MERLRYYIAHNNGLEVLQPGNGSPSKSGSFFEGRSIEHLIGSRSRPELVFAAVAFDGGYRTRDAGKTWEKIYEGDVRQFALDPKEEGVVYMGIGPVRLFRSEDDGTTWEPLDGLLAVPDEAKKKWGVPGKYKGKEFPHVRFIFVHPDDTSLLFILLEHGGVLLSRDRGKTWEDCSDGIDYVDMHVLENYPGSKERFYVSSARGFYRTDDCGAHWYRAQNGMPFSETPLYCYSHEWRFVEHKRPRMVVCGGRGSPGVWNREHVDPRGHILLSDDGGESWRIATDGIERENPWMPWVLLEHPIEPQKLFCGTGTGGRGFALAPNEHGNGAFYVSRDAGESWEFLFGDGRSVQTAWVAAD
jgi:hypothetical protein